MRWLRRWYREWRSNRAARQFLFYFEQHVVMCYWMGYNKHEIAAGIEYAINQKFGADHPEAISLVHNLPRLVALYRPRGYEN